MYENSKELIKMLKAFLFEEKYNAPQNIDIGEIFKIAKIHDVGGMMCAALEAGNVNMSSELARPITMSKILCGIKGAVREQFFEEINSAFNEAGVENIIVKGYVLRELYPVPDLRTMGDLDFVIRREDSSKMEKAMKSMGYSLEQFFKGEWSFLKNKQTVEVHERLTESELGNGFDYEKYLDDCFSHTVEYKGLTKTLNKEYHLIYMLIHCAKHFYNEGSGIRMIMDFAAYLKKYNDNLDWEYLNKELKDIILYDFSQSIWYLCQEWFGIKAQGKDYTMDEDVYNELFRYVMEGGVYGVGDLSRLGNKIVRSGMEDKNVSKTAALWKKLKIYIFLDDKTMRSQLEWYSKMPSFLLPVAWVSKACKSLKRKGLGHTKEILASGRDSRAAIREYNMLKSIGLYKK